MTKLSNLRPLFLSLVMVIGLASCNKDKGGSGPEGYRFLKEVTKEQRFTKEYIIAYLDKAFPGFNIASSPLAAKIKDIDVAAITYNTVGVNGKLTVASGVVAIPVGTKDYDHLLSIQHSTLDMEEAPSVQMFYYEMAPVINNQIVVMADYLGYGASQTADRRDTYMHNENAGRVCVDMIEAAYEYLSSKHITALSAKVELMGYSQGANATMATLYEMEKRNQGAFIGAVHAGGGAYDLTSMFNLFTTTGIELPRTGYAPCIIRGISYGEQVRLNDAKIYSPTLIEKGGLEMFNTKPLSQWHGVLGTDITKVLHPDFFAAPTFNGNADIKKFYSMLEKNSLVLYDAPKTAVKLYHSKTDDFVPYSNATAAKSKWSNATLIDLNSEGHIRAGAEFIFRCMGLWEQ